MMSTNIAFVRRLAPFEVDCPRCDVTVGRIEIDKHYFFAIRRIKDEFVNY